MIARMHGSRSAILCVGAVLCTAAPVAFATDAAIPAFSDFCAKAETAHSPDKELIEYLQRTLKAGSCESLGARLEELTELNGLNGSAEANGKLFPQNVSSLAIVRYMPKLRVIDMPYGSPVADLAPLAGLTNLVRLRMSASKIQDLTPLKGLSRLEELDIRTTRVKDLTPIMDLTNLKRVDLRNLKVPRAQIEAFKVRHPQTDVTL